MMNAEALQKIICVLLAQLDAMQEHIETQKMVVSNHRSVIDRLEKANREMETKLAGLRKKKASD